MSIARTKMQTLISVGLGNIDVVADPVFDARLLLMSALPISQNDLISEPGRQLTEQEARRVTTITMERASGVPVARLVGEAEFWSLPFYLSDETLIPRPDSERVVEAALDNLAEGPLSVLDIGTGTGCLALSILSERKSASCTGVDISAGALAVAQRNAVRLDLTNRFFPLHSDLFAKIPLGSKFNLIVSNPPYIASDIIPTLGFEVRVHDPHLALDGGMDGLDIYRKIIQQADQYLAVDGVLILEIGFDQGVSVAELLTDAGYESELLFDLGNQPRVLVGHKISANA
ncbi:MAG: peptide chain release factor N(5)-glutamine methyltransferase [Hyphomicrobiales bacterium]